MNLAQLTATAPRRVERAPAHQVEYELEDIAENEWQDEEGNPVQLDPDEIQDDQRAAMSWASNWRRTFGTVPR